MTGSGRSKSPEPCVICGRRRQRNAEDTLPDWLRRELKRLDPTEVPRRLKLRICRHCNSEMGRLFENDAADVIKPMVAGLSLVLTERQQMIVGSWVTKTVLLMALRDVQNPQKDPASRLDKHRHARLAMREMLSTGLPPSLTSVHLAAVQFRQPDLQEMAWVEPPGYFPPLPRYNSVLKGFAHFKHFMIQVVIGHPTAVSHFEGGPQYADWFVRVWPPQVTEVVWPPPKALSRLQFEMLQDAWGRSQPWVDLL